GSQLAGSSGRLVGLTLDPDVFRAIVSDSAAWIRKGEYFSGCSIESTARSMSRSGQYKWCELGSWTFAISRTDASRNHGNRLNGTNNSRSPIKSQNPWGETLVTSAREVLGPGAADFIQVLLDQS